MLTLLKLSSEFKAGLSYLVRPSLKVQSYGSVVERLLGVQLSVLRGTRVSSNHRISHEQI